MWRTWRFQVGDGLDAALVALLQGGATQDGRGNALNNVITGDQWNNALYGAAGKDTLTGGAGDDILDGGAGADSMKAASATATAYVDDKGDKVAERRQGQRGDGHGVRRRSRTRWAPTWRT